MNDADTQEGLCARACGDRQIQEVEPPQQLQSCEAHVAVGVAQPLQDFRGVR